MQLTVLIQMQIDQGHGQYATWQCPERVAKIIAKVASYPVLRTSPSLRSSASPCQGPQIDHIKPQV